MIWNCFAQCANTAATLLYFSFASYASRVSFITTFVVWLRLFCSVLFCSILLCLALLCHWSLMCIHSRLPCIVGVAFVSILNTRMRRFGTYLLPGTSLSLVPSCTHTVNRKVILIMDRRSIFNLQKHHAVRVATIQGSTQGGDGAKQKLRSSAIISLQLGKLK